LKPAPHHQARSCTPHTDKYQSSSFSSYRNSYRLLIGTPHQIKMYYPVPIRIILFFSSKKENRWRKDVAKPMAVDAIMHVLRDAIR